MTTINIQEEIQKALLDDKFIVPFAEKLKKALNGEPPMHDPETLDISLNVSEDDPTTFILNVNDLYAEAPVITATQRGVGGSFYLGDHLTSRAIIRLREAEVAGEGRYWAGLVKLEG